MPKYTLGKEIGSGTFGKVFSTNDRNVVAKILESESKEYLNEIDILKTCSHENIVKYIDSEKIDKGWCIYMEACQQNLNEYHNKKRNVIQNLASELFVQVKQIFTGLKYLHENNIIHRDIKPQNILVAYGNFKLILKIADFGLAVKDPENYTSLKQTIGTDRYMAPEVIESSTYNYKVDVFSAGATFLRLCFHRFNTGFDFVSFCQLIRDSPTIVENICAQWQSRCPGIENLLTFILNYAAVLKPEKRYTSEQFLEVI